jgi:hypothetical protein
VDYDLQALITKDFFTTVQNKLHWAITGQAAAERNYFSADADGAQFDLGAMRARFYELMEIDPKTGMPTHAALENCGMADSD